MGVGLGLFGSHVAPLLLAATPKEYLSRVQAVATLSQTLPLVVGLNLAGLIVSVAGIRGALLVMGGVVCVVGVLAVLSRPVVVRPDPRFLPGIAARGRNRTNGGYRR